MYKRHPSYIHTMSVFFWRTSYIYVYTYLHTHVYVYICTYIYTYMYRCMYVCVIWDVIISQHTFRFLFVCVLIHMSGVLVSYNMYKQLKVMCGCP